jgi:hypothetical protein
MNYSVILSIDYREEEVISAARLRLLNSQKPRIIAIVIIIASVISAAMQVNLWLEVGVMPENWYTPLVLLAIFFIVFIMMYYFVPRMDYHNNATWMCKLTFHFNEKTTHLSRQGIASVIDMSWESFKKVWENKKVYILVGKTDLDFLIIPKRCITGHEIYFRECIEKYDIKIKKIEA